MNSFGYPIFYFENKLLSLASKCREVFYLFFVEALSILLFSEKLCCGGISGDIICHTRPRTFYTNRGRDRITSILQIENLTLV